MVAECGAGLSGAIRAEVIFGGFVETESCG